MPRRLIRPKPVRHLLREVDGGKHVVRARCGAEERKRPADPMPDDFTAWVSGVSCPACLSDG